VNAVNLFIGAFSGMNIQIIQILFKATQITGKLLLLVIFFTIWGLFTPFFLLQFGVHYCSTPIGFGFFGFAFMKVQLVIPNVNTSVTNLAFPFSAGFFLTHK
jgi:hypothetical protein